MKPFAQQTYYELLEVPPSASDEDIRAAHQRLMELYSPDSIAVYALGDPDQVDALREKMTEAMEMLTDADLRIEYDRSLGLPTERLAKASAAAGALDKADSAARVAEALATAAAALAKAAGAVDAERVEAESRLKVTASVNDEESPHARGTSGKSEERMRGEESKRQEASDLDAQGAPSEPVMVGGVAVVEAFRASFTQSLSFVYVPAGPLRGQGRGVTSGSPAPAASPPASGVEAGSQAQAPADAAASTAPSQPMAALAEKAVEAAPVVASPSTGGETGRPEAPPPVSEVTPAASTAERLDVGTASAEDAASAVSAAVVASTPDPANAATSVTPASSHAEAPADAASPASAVTPPTEAHAATPTEASAAPSLADSTQPEAQAATGAQAMDGAPAAVATAPGESDPNPAPDARAPTAPPDATPEVSSTALARTPATGASRAAVRPLTSRPIDSRAAANTRPVPGSKGPVTRKLGDAQVLAQDSAIATAESALAQVAARVREARPRGVDIPADAEFNGELLRRVREARSLSIQQLADRTRISVRHLENVEADRYTALPPPVYLRGILMNLARELGLDPLRVSKSYLGLFSDKPAKSGR
ncbi:DnaJ domain-containing protein [Corallococcus sp. ZKHCc1 1396]|uniref:DnaJ domain-containing protein n=1 Tax=Corallococcus soli TaxID=2710757 RepID=A0ABR9PXZ2_9BACT|nr:helix-turn-helix domain-containing protein [Corallococcus soli]MBE4752773.1 DnaJ domain-containing protein [Corallococcus soli]